RSSCFPARPRWPGTRTTRAPSRRPARHFEAANPWHSPARSQRRRSIIWRYDKELSAHANFRAMARARTSEELEARREALSVELGEALSLDSLTRDFCIYQRVRGHRHSTDDLLTAWYAATHVAQPPET